MKGYPPVPVERILPDPPPIESLVAQLIGDPKKIPGLFAAYQESQQGQMPDDREVRMMDMISMMVDRANMYKNKQGKERLYTDGEFDDAQEVGRFLYNALMRGKENI